MPSRPIAAGKDPQGADGEVLLDIEVAGALAPKATLVVYFAPNTPTADSSTLSPPPSTPLPLRPR